MELPDKRVYGHYEIDELLGSGGMGAVYRAHHRLLDRPCALKVLPPQLTLEPGFHDRFLREAALAASLRHPNVVQIYDFGEEDGTYYLIMELVEGTSLRDMLSEAGALPFDRALRLLDQLAAALDYMHERDIVYRDLKPTNLMVSADDHMTVVDFGAARTLESPRLTTTGMLVGTPQYLAPELISGQAGGPAADLYSLGVVAYEMLTGKLPFDASSFPNLLYQIVHESPVSPSELSDQVPEAAAPILLRQIGKDPDSRFPSSAAFMKALHQAGRSSVGRSLAERTTEAVRMADRRSGVRRAVVRKPGRGRRESDSGVMTLRRETRQTRVAPVPSTKRITFVALLAAATLSIIALAGASAYRLVSASPAPAAAVVAQPQAPAPFSPSSLVQATQPSGTVVFQTEDSAANQPSWELRNDAQVRSYFQGSSYHVENLSTVEHVLSLKSAQKRFSDLVYEADLQKVSGPDDGFFGISFRQDSNDGYFLLINSLGRSGLHFRSAQVDPSTGKRAPDWLLGPHFRPSISAQGVNRLRAVANGPQITLYINGYWAGEMSDALNASEKDGTIGLWVGPGLRLTVNSVRVFAVR